MNRRGFFGSLSAVLGIGAVKATAATPASLWDMPITSGGVPQIAADGQSVNYVNFPKQPKEFDRTIVHETKDGSMVMMHACLEFPCDGMTRDDITKFVQRMLVSEISDGFKVESWRFEERTRGPKTYRVEMSARQMYSPALAAAYHVPCGVNQLYVR